MALEGGEWGILAGVLVIILSMMGYNHFAALRANAGAGKRDEGPSVNPMLSRFVVHDGNVVGEVMAADEAQLIIKHQGKFRAVDTHLAVLKDDEVHIVGDVDWDAAAKAGEGWFAQNTKGQDDAITAELTTSKDVKKPAMEAFAARNDEEE